MPLLGAPAPPWQDVFASMDQFQSWFDFSGIVGSADGSSDEATRRIADAEHRNKARAPLPRRRWLTLADSG